MINTVIFDLDGTLLYTIEDLTDGVNYAMEQFHFPTHSIEEVRCMVGNGIRNLIKRAVPKDCLDFENVFQTFQNYYNIHCMDKTKPYEGIIDLLEELKRKGMKTAIVSNKNHGAAQALAKHFFEEWITVCIGQRDGIPKKPAKDMVDLAMKELEVSPSQVIYIGDSEVDYETSVNAGVRHGIVTWGFRHREDLEKLPNVHLIDRPEEIIDIVCRDGE